MKEFVKFNKEMLEVEHLTTVREIGRQIGVKSPSSMKKDKVISLILDIQNGKIEPVPSNKRGAPPKIFVDVSKYYVGEEKGAQFKPYDDQPISRKAEFSDSDDSFEIEGVLEQHISGYGFLRTNNYENSKDDIYVSAQNIKKYNMRRGDKIKGKAKAVISGGSAALQEVLAINDLDPQLFFKRQNFDDLLPYYPTDRIKLESQGQENSVAIRLIDLFCPLGMGQRGLIVAPPKTGKTTLLKMIAQSIEKIIKTLN